MKNRSLFTRRRSLTRTEQSATLADWMGRNNMTQAEFLRWLEKRGILIDKGYLSSVIAGSKCAGPQFRKVFMEITGVALVDGLVEDK